MNLSTLLHELNIEESSCKLVVNSTIRKIRFGTDTLSGDTLSIVDKSNLEVVSFGQQETATIVTNTRDYDGSSFKNINVVVMDFHDMNQAYNKISAVVDRYHEITAHISQLIIKKSDINEIIDYLYNLFQSRLCLLNNNKKLIYNIYDFQKVEQLYPLEIKKSSLSRLYGYIGFENVDDKYDLQIKLCVSLLNEYIYDNINDLLNTKDSFYDTMKNLVNNQFSEKDHVTLKNIGWKINDDYKLILIKLESGLFKYRDMFVHGNRLILDHPMFLYSTIQNNNLVLLMNKKNSNLGKIENEIYEFIEKYDLQYTEGSLNNNILNLYKYYSLGTYLMDHDISVSGSYDKNVKNIVYGVSCHNKFLDILIPKELMVLRDDDKKNNTDLLRTLYYYILEERSLMKAAEILGVHRNSIVYRTNKISELVNIDIENYESRQNILAALELMEQFEPGLVRKK